MTNAIFISENNSQLPTENQIDCRRNSVLGSPFFLSKKYNSGFAQQLQLEYIGHLYFGGKPPIVASLRVASTHNLGDYIMVGDQFWMDPRDTEIRQELDRAVSLINRSEAEFLISDEADRGVCSAYVHHASLRQRRDLTGAIEKYREEIDFSAYKKTPEKPEGTSKRKGRKR